MPLRRATALGVLVAAAGAAGAGLIVARDGSDPAATQPPDPAALSSARVSVTAPEGTGLAIWFPSSLADAVAGSDAVVTATVMASGDGPGIEGRPSSPGAAQPPALPSMRLTLRIEDVLSRAGWARKLPQAVQLHVLKPEEGPLGVAEGGRYVFFLAERDQVVAGDPRAYNTAWAGGFMKIADGRVAASGPDDPGTKIAGDSPTIEEFAAAVERAAADRGLAEQTSVESSPNPLIQARPRARKVFDYPGASS
jgi:hypothetical protein